MSRRLPLFGLTLATAIVAGAFTTNPAVAAEAGPSLEELLAPQSITETYGTRRDPSVRAMEMLALQERLAGARVDAALAQPFRVEVSGLDRQRIDRDGSAERRYLVGVARPVAQDVELSAARVAGGATRVGPGIARGAGDDEYIWTAAFESPGASALRLYLSGVDLPKGTELYVYSLAGQAFGPYTGRGPLGNGELHTHTVLGDRLILQLHTSKLGEAAARFRVEDVGVMGARFAPARYGTATGGLAPMASNLCSYNADCVVNAACQSSSVVNAAKDAVAGMLFRSGGSYYICTGGLIADTVTTSVIPYFLTANHCISSGREAESLETYFDYETTCNSPDCDQSIYNNNGDTIGATIKSGSSSNDHTLLQLSSTTSTPDGVVSYLGFNASPIANVNNTALYRISHPQGSPQAYSEQVVDTSKGTCGTLPRGRYIYSRDTLGATEGGSSGSPVVNGAGQIVGQLYGACGFNLNDVCDDASNATVDGALADSYASMAPFLSPSGGGSCTPVGGGCTSNSQCCSNNCKGKNGAKTCK